MKANDSAAGANILTTFCFTFRHCKLKLTHQRSYTLVLGNVREPGLVEKLGDDPIRGWLRVFGTVQRLDGRAEKAAHQARLKTVISNVLMDARAVRASEMCAAFPPEETDAILGCSQFCPRLSEMEFMS